MLSYQTKISPSAQIAQTAIIEDGVEIGDNTIISDYVIIRSGVKIGANNHIYPHVVLGEIPQDKSFMGEESFIEIGDNNVMREFVSIHKASGIGQKTIIGNNNFLMVGVHLGHNVEIGNEITLANNVALGGHVIVEDYANIGGGSMIHQHCRIGEYAMIAGSSACNHDALPFFTYVGTPAKAVTTNRHALKKNGFDQSARSNIMRAFKLIYTEKASVPKILERLNEHQNTPHIKDLIEFIEKSKRSIILDRFKSDLS